MVIPVKTFSDYRWQMLTMSQRVAGFGTTVFVEINNLARQFDAVNLGQGAPDFDGPPEILAAAVEAVVNGAFNQYAPGIGMPTVREAIAGHAERFYRPKLDPETDVLVTSGATEAVFAAILGLTDPGDEVIVFEPVYDTYVPNLVMAGVTPRYVPTRWDIVNICQRCAVRTGRSIPTSWQKRSAAAHERSSSIRRTTRQERCTRPRN